MSRPDAPQCCGQPMTPIVYGRPSGKALFEAAERGEVVLGGCVISDDMPLFVCSRCRRTAGRLGGEKGAEFERDDRT